MPKKSIKSSGKVESLNKNENDIFVIICPICKTPTLFLKKFASGLANHINSQLGISINIEVKSINFICKECNWTHEFTSEQISKLQIKHIQEI